MKGKKISCLILAMVMTAGIGMGGWSISSQAQELSDVSVETKEKTITRISVSPESQSLEVGGGNVVDGHGAMGEKIIVTAFYSDNTSKVLDKKEDVKWTISDPKIANIDWWENSIIYGNSYVPAARMKVGTTIATAKVGDCTATCTISSIPKDINNNTSNRPDYEPGKIESISDMTYTGSPITPDVKLTFGMWEWKENEDYTVSYTNNTQVGTATITVTGINRLKGSVSTTFNIIKSEQPVVYPVKDMENSTITDIEKGVTFTIDVPFDKFVGVTVNGRKLIRDKEYTAKAGSTIITLLPEYLKTLTIGEYGVSVEFTDGIAKASFTKPNTNSEKVSETNNPNVNNKAVEIKKSPQTGDEASVISLIMLLASSVVIGAVRKFAIK